MRKSLLTAILLIAQAAATIPISAQENFIVQVPDITVPENSQDIDLPPLPEFDLAASYLAIPNLEAEIIPSPQDIIVIKPQNDITNSLPPTELVLPDNFNSRSPE